jgi:hypothetical protein
VNLGVSRNRFCDFLAQPEAEVSAVVAPILIRSRYQDQFEASAGKSGAVSLTYSLSSWYQRACVTVLAPCGSLSQLAGGPLTSGPPTVEGIGSHRAIPCEKTAALFFECFPYVCPEPVLVKRSVLYYITSGQKVPCSHLLLPLVVPPAVVLDGRDGQLDVIKVRKELPDEKGSVK